MNTDTQAGNAALPENLAGLWDSYADSYVISPGRVEYDYSFGEDWQLSFAGDIRHIAAFDQETGVIIIEYTEPPKVPYGKGRSGFLAIYYRMLSRDAAKFWNSWDGTGTDTLTLEQAIEKFSEENSSRFVFSWDGAYTLYRQDAPVFNMGPLRGNWQADDSMGTWLKISDHRLSLYMGAISPATILYTGAIVDTTDPAASSGRIFIQFSTDDDCGLAGAKLDARAGDFYVLRWARSGDRLALSVYNDNPAVLSAGLEDLRAVGDDAFAETGDSAGGLAVSGAISVEFLANAT